MAWKSVTAALALLVGTLLACLRPPPVIEHHSYAPAKPLLTKIAVAPFYLGERLRRSAAEGVAAAEDARAMMERVIAEEIAARVIEVVPAGDVKIAFVREDITGLRVKPRSGAAVVFESFGATAMLLGEVQRFRERAGTKRGATHPASVAFVVTLYAAPSGKRLWSARFDETQASFSEAPGRARRYPGGGRRWLTAHELARFGAGAAVEALVSSP